MSFEKQTSSLLSQRGARTAACKDFLYDKMVEIFSNIYHPEKNPKVRFAGII